MCVSALSRSTSDTFAPPSQGDRGGRPFCAIMRHRSGPATRLQVTDLFFRPLFAFFIIELKSRCVIHVGVTRSPTDPWVAQQLREATPYGQAPKYLIRDHESKFGPCFARVATTSAIGILKTPYHAPRANAICECFVRSVRQACLDHLLIFHEKQHEPRAKSRMWRTSIGPDHIKGYNSRFPHRMDHLVPLRTKEPG